MTLLAERKIMNSLIATMLLQIAVSTAIAKTKTADEIPCFSNKNGKMYYSAQLRDTIYENTTRMNFAYPDGFSNDKRVYEFYQLACSKRSERLSEHRVPVVRLLVPGDPQSIWIDKEGNVEFDAWDTTISKTLGLQILRIIQDEYEKAELEKNDSPTKKKVK